MRAVPSGVDTDASSRVRSTGWKTFFTRMRSVSADVSTHVPSRIQSTGRTSFFTLEGSARLWIILEYAPVAYVRTLLPPYLELLTPSGVPTGTHPLLYSFGEQTVRLAGLPWFSRTYRESIIGVCSVSLKRRGSYSGPFSLMTSACVDSLLPMLIGRLLGYPKALRRIAMNDRTFDITTFWTGRPVMSGRFDTTGPDAQPSTDAAFTVSEILAHPVISRAAWGTLLASRFQNATGEYEFTPIKGTAAIAGEQLEGLPGGVHQWPAAGAANVAVVSMHEWFSNPPDRVR